ncbi:MAG TPA: hypothetical protein VJK06_00775 [Methyloceanibacter sp.]|nr:hypothetical protein [Methyloceanibacter sp.]
MAAKPRKKSGKLVPAAELSRAWEYHKNADQVLGARMSYGMIAQSMFLLSYVTLYLVAAEPIWLPVAVQLGIATFGLWYTSRQNAMAMEEIARMRFLRKEYLSKDRIFAGHLPEDHPSCGTTTSRLIPGFFVLWGALAALASVLIVLEVLGYAKTGT